ncbi:hypothetical protein OIDMADRAFT_165810 [Oidiodendron maius Zn]|uniref:AAA+ ATPase domain-containing protein n=1 Tax=Oidiodendron maius (strain Zn) TaxID=913774 RepID=A0A0C3H8S1_OIDMZ|nr:hypothetical protein OIDMADRAFT_165810 [Oidiodendron maius Zn]
MSGSSGSPLPISPTTLLETFIPGYGPIHKFVLYSFGFDVTVLVSLGAALWLAARIGRSIWKVLKGAVTSNWMAEISVSSTDEIHTHLLHFLAFQYRTRGSRRLIADTPTKSAWELDGEETEALDTTMDANGNIKWLNFSNQEAKTQPRFTPAIGSHNFWHNGTFFQLSRKEVTMFDEMGGGGSTLKDKEILTLSCFGRSTNPIKALMQDAKEHYHRGHNVKTIIKRPAPKDLRRWGGRGAWVKIAERPCRPMKTVVLDEKRKMDVLADINEYLNPVTARWYANRGIPYRRGYLFYGPPGTGKTSLTFALAGVFGLDIHVVSLLEPTLTEEELGMLFTNLPPRCIVLLEDIDTAGLMRNDPESDDAKKKAEVDPANTELNVATLTKALKKAHESDEDRKKGISLSGLLNIIDGVASHEGRVLVMTTNRPENLDDALIRPGRVDHQVSFSNANQHQAKELFERMYANDLPRTRLQPSATQNGPIPARPLEEKISLNGDLKKELTPPATPTSNGYIITDTAKEKPDAIPDSKLLNQVIEDVQGEELRMLAQKFAENIPDNRFSPAELQGFLLKRKKDPRKARDEVGKWVEEMMEVKRTGGKLVPQ